MLSPVSFGASFSPLFGSKKRGTKLVQNPPEVTRNHLKDHQVGDVVEFDKGRFKLTKQHGAPRGHRWVATTDQPRHTPYSGNKRR